MACKLTKQDNGSFRGDNGAVVTVGLRSDEPASTVRIIYAGEEDGEAPFEFTLKPGKSKLLIAALGIKNNQKMRVVELDGVTECPLKTFFWSSTHFHTTLDIEGV
ncbi:MAG TPA: hypothetical protein VE422_06965 [Terriglobia bacterium]|nr:hypothetical protein [Terriglobia bacterium]